MALSTKIVILGDSNTVVISVNYRSKLTVVVMLNAGATHAITIHASDRHHQVGHWSSERHFCRQLRAPGNSRH